MNLPTPHPAAGGASSARRPNILFITTDQQRADCIGVENPQLRTPHLDALAASGTRFANCIAPSVVCQPARASILTGQLPLTHGAWDNGVDLDPAVGAQGMAATLAAAGYSTAFIGKAHFSTKNTFKPTGTPECRQSAPDYPDTWFGPYMGFEHVELAALGKFHPKRLQKSAAPIHRFEHWFLDHPGAQALWLSSLREGSGAAQTWDSALPAAWHSSAWVADRTLAMLQRRADLDTNPDQPFFAWASFPDPHHPFDCPAPWRGMYDPADMVLPRHRTLDLERRPWWHRAALEGQPQIADPELAKFRQEGFKVPPQSDRQLAEMMANYYGMISLVDHQVGRILDGLRQSGLAANTLVVFASDHGDMLGDHGLYLKGPMIYEGVLRVPLIIAGPGVAAGQTVATPVSTIDLASTFLQSAGLPCTSVQSRSLHPVMAGTEQRECAWSEWHVHPSRLGVALQLRTVRTARYSCTIELGSGSGELYDLQDDPQQLVNRFDDPAWRSVREQMHALLLARPGPLLDTLAEPVGMA
jgi:arylsulfatase A-like enzyme